MRIKLNPDKEAVSKAREGLKENNGFCPCKVGKLPENKCICQEFLEQKSGMCHCGLYFKQED
jgi:ferredoxin-thioredoxin reductase catalytic subunit